MKDPPDWRSGDGVGVSHLAILQPMLLSVKVSIDDTTTQQRVSFHVLVCHFRIYFLFMFYQLLRVQHSSSSTQSRGSVLPSIVKMRDQNSQGCPLLFLNRNLYTHSLWEVVDHSRSKMLETCLIIIHDPDFSKFHLQSLEYHNE